MSFHGGRTIADAGVPAIARRMSETCGGSIGVCSVSTTRKSKPALPSASAVAGAPLTSHTPYGVAPEASARLKELTGMSMIQGSRILGRRRLQGARPRYDIEVRG